MNELQLETMTRLRVEIEKKPELDKHAVMCMSKVSVCVGLYTELFVNVQGVIKHGPTSLTTYQAIDLLFDAAQ